MSLNTAGIFAAMLSHGQSLGLFERVKGHEPKNAPGNGLSLAIWTKEIEPAVGSSGLNSTTGLITFSAMALYPAFVEPQEEMEQALLSAVDELIRAYSGDFTLGGMVRNVDLLNEHGAPLGALFGYTLIDNTWYRQGTVTVPVVINDLWTEAP